VDQLALAQPCQLTGRRKRLMTTYHDGGSGCALEDWCVVELASGVPGGYCTRLLADAGALVIKVEGPAGDDLRRWSASLQRFSPGQDGALFQFLAGSKRSLAVDVTDPADRQAVEALLERADAVVWSAGSPVADDAYYSPSALFRRHPHLVVGAITIFGLAGPWATRPATEFTAQAWSGGIISWGRGDPDRPPRYVPGRVGEWLVGTYAAFALLSAFGRARDSGIGELLDVPMIMTQVSTLAGYDVLHRDMAGTARLESGRCLLFPGVHEASDGYLGLLCGAGQRWLDYCSMVGHPEWGTDESLFDPAARAARTADILPAVREWMAERTTEEVKELAGLFRISTAPVVNGQTAPHEAHFIANGMFETNADGGFTQPASPFRLHGTPECARTAAPRLGEANGSSFARLAPRPRGQKVVQSDRPLDGLRILDMTSVWAGPMGTRMLAALGAEVIHLESTVRPDFFRFQSIRRIGEDSWWEWASNFAGANGNKLGMTLNLQTAAGRDILLRLVKTCDAVVENFAPRVLEKLDLGYETLKVARPDVILVRMPGYGLRGPWRDKPAFAPTIEDAAGLTWLTGYSDGPPEEPFGVADTNAGIHAMVALLQALLLRRKTGRGVLVEAPMVGAALSINAEPVIEYSAYGVLLERAGNSGPAASPQNLYRTRDLDDGGRPDRWVAIAVATTHQWAALCNVIGRPEWADDERYRSPEGRRRNQAEIDSVVAAWCETRSASEIVSALWSSGIPVGDAIQPQHAGEIEQLRAYGFYEELDHPIYGRGHYDTPAFRSSRGPNTFNRLPAPTLGQHNRDILRGIGLTDDEISQLERDEVIGYRPSGM